MKLRHLKNTGITLYSPWTSSRKWVCFDCRVCFHKWNGQGGNCMNCSKPMLYAGSAFRAPPKRDIKEWAKLEVLIRGGVMFNYCGGNGQIKGLTKADAQQSISRQIKQRLPTNGGHDLGLMTHAVRVPGSGKRVEKNSSGSYYGPDFYEL